MNAQVISFLKLLLYTLILNVLRYFPGSILEQYTIMGPMHAPMEQFPDCFGFRPEDFPTSLIYNFMLWFSVVILFHWAHRHLNGAMWVKSLQVFGICCLFFVSLAAVYMNHYTEGMRPFYRYSMLDALILFAFLGLINGFLYPLFFRKKQEETASSED
jgi:hypothetical protein